MPADMVRIAMGQMLVEGGRPAENLDRAAAFIRSGAAADCHFVVLPECLDLGWTHPSARDLAEPIPGPHSERLARAAREAGVYVVAGLVECTADGLYNAAVLIDPQGQIQHIHRKINELDIARTLYGTGTQLAAVRTPLGVLGINVCADNFPETIAIGQSLAMMGAQIVLSPCCWAVEADHDNRAKPYGDLWRTSYGELGRSCGLPVVGVSNVGVLDDGPWKDRKVIGCSMATDRRGQVIAAGPYGESAEAMIPVEIELRSSL